jgi:hypothetical protein
MDVDSNNNVQVECNGIKIFGDVNAHLEPSGMEISALLMLVKMDKFGMKALNHVNVLEIKFSQIKHVSLHKLLAQMVEFGINLFMLVHAHKELMQLLQPVILFQVVLMVEFIIL